MRLRRGLLRQWGALTLTVALTAGLAACSGDDEPQASQDPSATDGGASVSELQKYYGQQVVWEACDPGFECAKLEVPLDYAKPDGRTIKVAVNRAKATGDRIGSLVLNPGGPGASGLTYALEAKRNGMSEPIRERFDLVGFDPRGVGKSAPIDCVTDSQLDTINAIDGTPDTPAEERALKKAADTLSDGCQKRGPELAAHIGTREVARDMDVLRQALGDEKLNFFGASYGTYMGALYAEAFPGRVGRFVLDGALDPRVSSEEVARVQAAGFEQALGAFIDDCLTRDDCPLQGPKANAFAQIRGIMQRADKEPYPTAGKRDVTEALLVLGVATALYDRGSGWPFLRLALGDTIKNGIADRLLQLADLYTNRGDNGYTTNAIEALAAISCLDRASDGDLEDVRRSLKTFTKDAPTFGPYLAWGSLTCAQWDVPAQGKPGEIKAAGAPPILVIGTTRDPATPVSWAEGLAEQLESGVLLVRDGDGHLAYREGNDCIDAVVDAYLLDGAVPEDGRRCAEA